MKNEDIDALTWARWAAAAGFGLELQAASAWNDTFLYLF